VNLFIIVYSDSSGGSSIVLQSHITYKYILIISFCLTPCLYFFISLAVVLLFVFILDCFMEHCWFQFRVLKKIHGDFTVVFLFSCFSSGKKWVVLKLRKKWKPKEKERKIKRIWSMNSPKQPKNEMKWKRKDSEMKSNPNGSINGFHQ